MIRYSLNFMGPITERWYEKHGITSRDDTWCGGRIDVYGLDENEYFEGRTEYSVPIMFGHDWYDFGGWLQDIQTDTIWSFEDLVDLYEKESNSKIRWFEEK